MTPEFGRPSSLARDLVSFALAIIAPPVLLIASMVLSHAPVYPGQVVVVALAWVMSLLVGMTGIWRLRLSRWGKIAILLLYLPAAVFCLMIVGLFFACSAYHDCP